MLIFQHSTHVIEFFHEIDAINMLMQVDLDVIECDAAIQKGGHYKYRKGLNIEIAGRGGTDFRPVFKYVKEKSLHPDILIYFTDGYGSWPEKAPRNYITIWVLTGDSGYGCREIPWGVNLKLITKSKRDEH